MARLDGHRTAEARSLAYHRRVADKLLEDPCWVARALARVNAIIERCGPESAATHYARGWRARLEGPLPELVAFLQSDAQEARDHRQASPFAGALSARERWQLWREAADASSSAVS